MAFMLPVINPSLNEKLKRISEIFVASCAVSGNADTIWRTAYQMYSLEMGIPLSVYVHSHWKEYGVSTKELTEKIITHYRDVMFPSYGLKLLVLAKYFVIHNDKEVMGIGLQGFGGPNYVSIRWFGYTPLIEELKKRLIEEERAEPESYQRFYIDDRNVVRDKTVVPPPFVPLEHFHLAYPYLKQTPEEFWAEFNASANNVTLLIGPPGTGKSSFLRCVLQARGVSESKPTYLADSATTIAHPQFMESVRSLPGGSVMLTEDSDAMLMKRENGNMEMSTLLNTTSGLAATDTKFFISTNLSSTRTIDTALLRRGRLYRVLEFRNLTIHEAQTLRDAMGLPYVSLDGFTNGLPLTDALNITESDCALRLNASFGFK